MKKQYFKITEKRLIPMTYNEFANDTTDFKAIEIKEKLAWLWQCDRNGSRCIGVTKDEAILIAKKIIEVYGR